MKPSVRMIGLTQVYHDPDWPFADLPPVNPIDLIEFAGRWDYGEKSVAKMTGKDTGVVERWLASGEESMVEMVEATFLITCSRVVSHELVRHRIASYQQESQRFVRYEAEGTENLMFFPPEIEAAGPAAMELYKATVETQVVAYRVLKDQFKVPNQIARYVLPNATRTRIIAKMNLREWRHVLRLRMHTSAQPEMRVVAELVHAKLAREFPILFPDDLAATRSTR